MNKKLTVIRTAAGCLSAIAMIKELMKRNVRVVGADISPFSAGLYLSDKGYVVPRGDDPKFIEELYKIAKQENADAIISGPESEVLALSKNKNLFNEIGTKVLVPDYETVKICVDKLETYTALNKIGVPTPKLYSIDSLDEINFPVIIKPRFGRGGRNVYKVSSIEELNFYLKKADNPIIQEFVDGTEYTIDTFTDMDGTVLSIVPRIRLQTESGISVKGITVYDEEIIKYTKKIVEELKIIGPAAIQCIKGADTIKFIEINARFGGGSILSLKADPSIIDNLLKIIRGEKPIPSKGFTHGLVMLRYYSEFFLSEKDIISSGNSNTNK